ncbi:MAG: L-amino acid N-acyltransferase [Actinomycetota bacterium]|jgi:phosphinothricin acetyltransferase|nr:L-amino acid N-acyltransferase [Actinomycetota bacterium]
MIASRSDPPAESSGVEIRLAGPDDAEEIRAIYNLEVAESTVTFDLVPRSLEAQQAWLAEHAGVHPAIVAVEAAGATGRAVVGFGSLAPYRPRPAYATTVENSIYVRHDRQGQGYGRAILEELLRLATRHGFHAVMARIVDGHEVSIALHRSCDFEVVGVEREVGRKFGRWLDVVLMERLL